ncbi:MAG: hypothetical protein LBD34_02655 [Puniceicoccales bacterium]|nr:hypothetical protein [Puniceicoccales bacterium]
MSKKEQKQFAHTVNLMGEETFGGIRPYFLKSLEKPKGTIAGKLMG